MMRGLERQQEIDFQHAIFDTDIEKIRQFHEIVKNAVGDCSVLAEKFEYGSCKGQSIFRVAAAHLSSAKVLLWLNGNRTNDDLARIAGDTLLSLAEESNPDMVFASYLLKLKPEKNWVSTFAYGQMQKSSALHYSVYNAHAGLLSLLLAAGFDPLYKNAAGNSTIDLAYQKMQRPEFLWIIFLHGYAGAGKKMLELDKTIADDFLSAMIEGFIISCSESQMEQDGLIGKLRVRATNAALSGVTRDFARLLVQWLETGFLSGLSQYFKEQTGKKNISHPLIFFSAALEIHHILCGSQTDVSNLIKIRDKILGYCPEIMKKSLGEEIEMMHRFVRAQEGMLQQRFRDRLQSYREDTTKTTDLVDCNNEQLIRVIAGQGNIETKADAALLLQGQYAEKKLLQGSQGRFMLLQTVISLSEASNPDVVKQQIFNVSVEKYLVHRNDTECLRSMQKFLAGIVNNREYGLKEIRQKYQTDNLLCLLLLALRAAGETNDWLHEEGKKELATVEKRIVQSYGKLLQDGGYSAKEIRRCLSETNMEMVRVLQPVATEPVLQHDLVQEEKLEVARKPEVKRLASQKACMQQRKVASPASSESKLPDFPDVPQHTYRYGESTVVLFSAKAKVDRTETEISKENRVARSGMMALLG